MHLYNDQPSGTVDQLRDLRRNAPAPERKLLRALREAFPDLKWRHQVPIGPYRADLLCFAARLVIEVDGDTHVGAEAYDARRTAIILREGYRVVRFTNAEVMSNIDGVIAAISLSLREREGAAKGSHESITFMGAPQRRKGEGGNTDRRQSPSPSHAAARRGPLPLPMGEER